MDKFASPPAPLRADGERFLPGQMTGAIEVEHLHRYRFAAQFVAGKVVLDIACGEGYGTALLAATAQRAVGVDIAQEAVAHAQAKYGAANLEYLVGSCAQIPLDDAAVDVVVSFETIEHHDEHDAMLREIRRVLRPGGLLVISSPDKREYSDKPGYRNPFHVHELYREEFEALLASNFRHRQLLGQRVLAGSALFGDAPSQQLAFGRIDANEPQATTLAAPVYWVAVASDEPLPAISGGLLEQSLDDPRVEAVRERNRTIAELLQSIAVPGSRVLRDLLHGSYLQKNPDIAAAGVDPEAHWNMVGRIEGRELTNDPAALVQALAGERQQQLLAEIDALRRVLGEAQAAAEERQRALAGELAGARLAGAEAVGKHLRDGLERERGFAAELARLQGEAAGLQGAADAKLAAAIEGFSARERQLLEELAGREREVRAIEREGLKRLQQLERELAQEKGAAVADLAREKEKGRVEVAAQLKKAADRERQVASELLRVRAEAEAKAARQLEVVRRELADQVKDSARREERLRADIARQQDELRRIEHLRVEREQAVQAAIASHHHEAEERLAAVRQQAESRATALAQQHAQQHAQHEDQMRQQLAADRLRHEQRWGAAVVALARPAALIDPGQAATSIDQLLSLEDAEFVQCAYVTLLGRTPDPEGLAYYLQRYREGFGKLHIVRQICRSDEWRQAPREIAGMKGAVSRDSILSLPLLGPLLRSLGLPHPEGDEARGLRRQERRMFNAAGALGGLLPAASAPSAGAALVGDHGVPPLVQPLDPDWYLAEYGDVRQAGMEPHEHYREAGKAEGRYANRREWLETLFDVEHYRTSNPDVTGSDDDLFWHFVNQGRFEQRQGATLKLSLFDPDYYLKRNPDVAASGLDPMRHFLTAAGVTNRPFSSYRTPEAVVPEPLTYSEPVAAKPVKVIAFYLPQFHPIPENDRWWGKGFTEWRNVTRARPFYQGHDQPRQPGELGFYDLRVLENLRRQAELARLHGVDAFCIYYYWFAGHRLLESPLDMLLAHPEIDIEFCCCWANENWTRRWDGLEQEVLMAQQHSPQDDIAFIAEFSKMFADRRYIRVGGKPLLVVYRPGLFPDMKSTAQRWRRWCRENGTGDIYIAMVESFDKGDPRDFGLDGSIQFPPANLPNRRMEHQLAEVDAGFAGHVFDYQYTAKSAKSHARPAWPQFRGVTPGWDNTARKMERGVSFFGATPELYGEWLDTAVAETMASQAPEHRLVFVNAWNEWAEGAYLEPDSRHGYAFLNRTREAVARHAPPAVVDSALRVLKRRSADVAVIVHLHYLELFESMAKYLGRLDGADLYFTVREGTHRISSEVIHKRFPRAVVVSYPNQGRDVLPFLRVMEKIQNFGYSAICKIHSKKSPHRPKDGEQWRDDLLEKLLGSESVVSECLAKFRAGAGIAGPAGHVLPGADYWGGNKDQVTRLAQAMGCSGEQLQRFLFPAGTMFWFAPAALKPLLALGLTPDDFESEQGQIDGTTAHAAERLIGLSASVAGLTVDELGAAGPRGDGYQFAARTASD